MEQQTQKLDKAMFGAGCFWGVEVAFRNVPGVVDVAVGYSGGHRDNPTYKQVCYEDTGHAEVVEVAFDPARVSYEKLVETFFSIHNPTTKNRQGPDIGSQYRSAIFTYNDEQARTARAVLERVEQSGKYKQPIVTEITPASTFWRGEEYHQRYLEKHGRASCHVPQ